MAFAAECGSSASEIVPVMPLPGWLETVGTVCEVSAPFVGLLSVRTPPIGGSRLPQAPNRSAAGTAPVPSRAPAGLPSTRLTSAGRYVMTCR